MLLAGLLVAFAIAFPAFMHRLNLSMNFAGVPIGMMDSLGHPSLVANLEKQLEKHATPELTYVTAVANQLGGNLERAQKLFEKLPGDARASRAAAALARGEWYLSMPTRRELFDAFARPASWLMPPRDTEDALPAYLMAYATLLFGLIFVLLAAVIPVAAAPDAEPLRGRLSRWIRRLIFGVVPGAFDLAEASVARGFVMLVLCGGSLVALQRIIQTALMLRKLEGTTVWIAYDYSINLQAPLPPDATKLDFLLAAPYAAQFWAIAIVCLVATLVLHAMRLPAIAAATRDDSVALQPTMNRPFGELA